MMKRKLIPGTLYVIFQKLAQQVIEGDDAKDAQEVALENRCIRLLVMRQPMACDLRSVTTAIKINYDLERIADNAVNIAQRALELIEEPILKPYIDIPRMADTVQAMLRDVLDAFVNQDVAKAMPESARCKGGLPALGVSTSISR